LEAQQSSAQAPSTVLYVEHVPHNDKQSSGLAMCGAIMLALALTLMLIAPIIAFATQCHLFTYVAIGGLVFEAVVCLAPGLLCLHAARTNMQRANGGGQGLFKLIVVAAFIGLFLLVITPFALLLTNTCVIWK
jgi:hypothetical protein